VSKEQLRRTNWLLFQPAAAQQPVWFKTYRTGYQPITLDQVWVRTSDGGQVALPDTWKITVPLVADAFAYGARQPGDHRLLRDGARHHRHRHLGRRQRRDVGRGHRRGVLKNGAPAHKGGYPVADPSAAQNVLLSFPLSIPSSAGPNLSTSVLSTWDVVVSYYPRFLHVGDGT
jgi:hypothetical protein